MSEPRDDFPVRREGVTIPTIWIAVALSLLLHGAAFWEWLPRLHLGTLGDLERDAAPPSIVVRLAPPPSLSPPPIPAPAPPPAAAVRKPPAPRPEIRQRAARSPPPPPVIALKQPAPGVVPAAPDPAPAPPTRELGNDLASYIENRRRSRAEPVQAPPPAETPTEAPPAESDQVRTERIVAGNLGSQQPRTFGYDPARGGGIFQIERMGYDNADFLFFGWNKDIRRNTKQLIEVRRGSNADIRIAVVRRMIVIIREYEDGDFVWESKRLGRQLTLSARASDNAGLENFMMREFFDDPRRP